MLVKLSNEHALLAFHLQMILYRLKKTFCKQGQKNLFRSENFFFHKAGYLKEIIIIYFLWYGKKKTVRTNSGNYNKNAVKWWYSNFEVLKIILLPNVLQSISFANLNHVKFNPSISSDTKRQLAICHTSSIDTLHVTWYPIALKQRQIQEWGKFFHYLSNMTIYWTLEMLTFPITKGFQPSKNIMVRAWVYMSFFIIQL